MDPLGLAMEHFDPLGRWRDQDAGGAIDVNAQLVDGRQVNGLPQLRNALLEDFDRIRSTLAEQLLIYALGRGLEYDDQCAVTAVVDAARSQGDTLGALIRAVAVSDPFIYRCEPVLDPREEQK